MGNHNTDTTTLAGLCEAARDKLDYVLDQHATHALGDLCDWLGIELLAVKETIDAAEAAADARIVELDRELEHAKATGHLSEPTINTATQRANKRAAKLEAELAEAREATSWNIRHREELLGLLAAGLNQLEHHRSLCDIEVVLRDADGAVVLKCDVQTLLGFIAADTCNDGGACDWSDARQLEVRAL